MDQLEIRQLLEEGKETFELCCDVMKQDAQGLKVRYDQLIEVGFTADQALDIIKARGSRI